MHGRRRCAALLGERTSVAGTPDLIGAAVWGSSICRAMVHRQTSELPEALHLSLV